MASDCSGASKRLVEELGGTSAGEALRAPPTGFGATLERYLENGSPSNPNILKRPLGFPDGLPFGQASVKLQSSFGHFIPIHFSIRQALRESVSSPGFGAALEKVS